MWFTENPWPPLALCGLLALGCVFAWSNHKRGLFLFAALGLSLLGCGIFLLERVIVTERERIEAGVHQFCRAFQQKDEQQALDFFSPQDIVDRLVVQQALKRVTVKDDLRVTDVNVAMKAQDSRAISHFRANATIVVDGYGDVGHQPFRCELTWQRVAGAWKIIKITRLDPISGKELAPWSGG
jgi:hypothetical protein